MANKVDLLEIGLSERLEQQALSYDSRLQMARVGAQHRDVYMIITSGGEMTARVSGKLQFAARSPEEYPAVGDWVLIEKAEGKDENAVIRHILPRRSCLERKAPGTGNRRQIIAANIDTLFICMAFDSDYNLRRIERYLAVAWDSMAVPVIVLTKSDLCDAAEARIAEVSLASPGVDVVSVSSWCGDGLEGIQQYLKKGKTVAFIGSSGVGKSTLLNRLMGADVQVTGSVREDDGKGRHVTTHRELFILPRGGVVIDTPGMREIQIASADVSRAFPDIEELASGCRFRDCRHDTEPDCAVKQAVEAGRLSNRRLESYKKLQKEAVFNERKESMTAAQAEKRKVMDMMGSLDAIKRIKNRKRQD